MACTVDSTPTALWSQLPVQHTYLDLLNLLWDSVSFG